MPIPEQHFSTVVSFQALALSPLKFEQSKGLIYFHYSKCILSVEETLSGLSVRNAFKLVIFNSLKSSCITPVEAGTEVTIVPTKTLRPKSL